ncbi:hypothetical protein E2C01_095755 [Portunus trituberculatus]|uniref:Uncharacterized protein n=1 Tax=Portunus trituberculatus TaxID=210409 RepID=A0A5B7K101_PORTR|nr:hypothetical protein [Portunus trituberculatus]
MAVTLRKRPKLHEHIPSRVHRGCYLSEVRFSSLSQWSVLRTQCSGPHHTLAGLNGPRQEQRDVPRS